MVIEQNDPCRRKTVLLRTCMIALAAMLAAWIGAPARAAERPNIVLFVVEDLSPRIGAFGDGLAETPVLDAMAAQGVRYPNVFTAAGVCAPSRAALITGMNQISIGAQNMRTRDFGTAWTMADGTVLEADGFAYQAVPPAEVKAFPELLRAAGYYTVNNSKTDYQFGEPFTIWDENGQSASWQNAPEDQPFFAMFSNNMTHESGMFREGHVETGGYVETRTKQVEALRAAIAPEDRTDPAAVTVPPFLPDTPAVRIDLANHYDNIRLMDGWVGEQMAALQAAGRLENTIVIWTTDHGDGIVRGKRTLYDSGLKVPMIVIWPDGRRAGEVDERLVSFVDLAPALLQLAGAEVPDYVQGRDFLQESASHREYVFAARDRLDGLPDRSRAVRDTRFKFIRNYVDRPVLGELAYRENLVTMQEMRRLQREGGLTPLQRQYLEGPRPPLELYDISADPHEMSNLVNDPDYTDEVQRLRATLGQWQDRIGDLGAIPEGQMAGQMMWPDEVQPKTGAPAILLSSDKTHVVMKSLTGGASIGYRFGAEEAGPWRLYTGPLAVAPGQKIDAKAIRYGYQESDVISLQVPAGN